MVAPLEKELLELTGIAYEDKNRQKQLRALAFAVNDLDDDNWRRLSPKAQTWYNEASEAIDSKHEIPDFEESPTAPKSESTKESTTMKAKKAAPKGNGSSKSKPVKTAKPRKPERKTEGVPKMIQRMVVHNPQITAKEINEKLAAKGVECSKFTVSSIRSNSLTLIRMLAAEGHIKNLRVP